VKDIFKKEDFEDNERKVKSLTMLLLRETLTLRVLVKTNNLMSSSYQLCSLLMCTFVSAKL
jgi:hypothetical protein